MLGKSTTVVFHTVMKGQWLRSPALAPTPPLHDSPEVRGCAGLCMCATGWAQNVTTLPNECDVTNVLYSHAQKILDGAVKCVSNLPHQFAHADACVVPAATSRDHGRFFATTPRWPRWACVHTARLRPIVGEQQPTECRQHRCTTRHGNAATASQARPTTQYSGS